MRFAKIKLHLYRLIYSQIKHTKLMTQNMRSPGNGFLGNIAKELMIVFNEFVYTDSIKKLNVQKNDHVIEIGSGNGQGIKKLLENIDDFSSAPIWTPKKISNATKTWFKYLSKAK